MICRIISFFRWLVLVLLLFLPSATSSTLTTPGATEKEPDGEVLAPRFVLAEEHHHVVTHLVRFAREGFLNSHTTRPEEERNPNGAILIHIDSHADMGLPPGLNHLPAKTLFSNLPPENTDKDTELIEHSEICDFLLLLGYMGIVEHIIYVEPPWSHLFRDAHHITVDISMGVVPGDDTNGGGATYGSVRNAFSNEAISEDAMDALESMMADHNEPVEIVRHEELIFHCLTKSDHCNLRTVRFTVLPYQGAAEAIDTLLDSTENKDRDIVLDVDLDAFSTTSPGALSLLQSTIPDLEVLTRIYHTVHDDVICDMEIDYWERLKTSGGRRNDNDNDNAEDEDEFCQSNNLSFVHGPSFQPPLAYDINSLANENPSDRAMDLVENSLYYYKLEHDEDVIKALAEVFEYYLPAIDASIFDDEKFVALMDDFLNQPFYVPDSKTIESVLDFHFDQLFRTIFASHRRRTPKVINVIRSPFYTPNHHLAFIECEVFGRFLDMFGSGPRVSPTLYHFDEVRVDRTNCLHEPNKFPRPNRFNIGTNHNIDEDLWKGTHKTYSWFHEDDDDIFGTDYKYLPISVDFVNEHKYPLLMNMKMTTGQSLLVLRVLPGQRVTEKGEHLTKWELFKAGNEEPTTKLKPPTTAPLLTIVLNGKNGAYQSYGSISGRIPVHHSTPVKMEVENPNDSGIRVALRTLSSEDDSETVAAIQESLSPGEAITLHTVHGKRWTIHDISEENNDVAFEQRLGEVIANATSGGIHSVVLFSDESTSAYEL